MKDIDKKIFHYTSLDGLLGISESKSIWGTNSLFLNDSSELNYAKDLFKEEVDNLRKTNSDFKKYPAIEKSVGYIFLELFEKSISELFPSDKFGFYICSFSEESDLLSQWRGYCSKGTGVSLGFNLNRMLKWSQDNKFIIRPCVYDENKQREQFKLLLINMAVDFNRVIGKSSDIEKAWNSNSKKFAAEFLLKFIEIAPLIKHPKFSEEKEWRVTVNLDNYESSSAIKFRSGFDAVVPYVEIPLPTKEAKLIIDKIVVGPSSDKILSMSSIKLLLKSRNVLCVEIESSEIPYRFT